MGTIFENVIDDIADKVPGKDKAEGDYYSEEDGLMYCGKCHTRKQAKVKVLGEERVVPIICKCQQEKDKALLDEMRAEDERRRINRLRRKCFPTPKEAACTFAQDDRSNPRISDAMRRYVEKWTEVKQDGMGLLLYGPVGTGKTFFAACIANALIDKGDDVMMTSFARIVNTMQGHFEGRQEHLDKLVSHSLLVIDDLGTERGSDYMLEQVYSVINARYQTGLPLILTTNISIAEIKEPADLKYQRIYDRVLEMCHPVEIPGRSRRRESVKKNFAARKELLGL